MTHLTYWIIISDAFTCITLILQLVKVEINLITLLELEILDYL